MTASLMTVAPAVALDATLAIEAAAMAPRYLLVYLDLRSRILSGQLAPGDRLARQDDLAREMGVTKSVVSAAVMRLARDGYIDRRSGRAAIVRPCRMA